MAGTVFAAEPIKLGVGIDPSFAAFYLADQEKLFAKAGLDVELMQYAQAMVALDALTIGQLQFSSAGEPTVMIRMARGDVRALAVLMRTERQIKLVLREGLNDITQIKNFGIIAGATSQYSTSKLIDKYHLDKNTVKMVQSDAPELPALLARGDIDAYFAFEPWPSMGVQMGGKIVANAADVGYPGVTWVITSGPWFDTHQEEAHKIVNVLAQACGEIRGDLAKGAAATEAEAKIPKAQALAMLKEVDCDLRDFTADDLASYDQIADWLVTQKITPVKVDFRKSIQVGFYKK